DQILQAYRDLGMRVSYSFALRDQNRLVYEADDRFLSRLPPQIAAELTPWLQAQSMPYQDHLAIFAQLWERWNSNERIWIQLVAETGTMICHNASSNLRLRSGVAPVNHFLARGVRVALGLDEAGMNDDRDMLQEMRLVLRLHRVPGMEDVVPTAPQVFQMA